MKILISNDDGLHATGIRTLIATLAKSTQHQLVVVAPDRERSATAHALTLHQPLQLNPVELGLSAECAGRVQAYAVSGTPCDCVKLGIHALWQELYPGTRPDAILSGINHGPNLGNDVIYSGTVSAAQEGSFVGIPSLALSLSDGYLPVADFQPGADWLVTHLQQLLSEPLPLNTVLNINFPPSITVVSTGPPQSRITYLGSRSYSDQYEKRLDPRQRPYYWLAGEVIDNPDGDPVNSDVGAVRAGYVSITPVTLALSQNAQLVAALNKELGSP